MTLRSVSAGRLAIVEGKSPPGPDEIVVDIEMKNRHGVQIGDRLVKGDRSLIVVGYSSGGDFIYTQIGFATLDTAIEFLELDPTTQRTFFVVTLDDPSERGLRCSARGAGRTRRPDGQRRGLRSGDERPHLEQHLADPHRGAHRRLCRWASLLPA